MRLKHLMLIGFIIVCGCMAEKTIRPQQPVQRTKPAPPAFDVEIAPQISHTQEVIAICYAPNGRFIATASKDKTVKLWTPDGCLIRTFSTPGLVPRIALSPDSKLLAIAAGQGVVDLWSVMGKHLRRFPRMHATMMGPVAFSPDNRLLVVSNDATKDDYCQVFDLEGHPLARLPNPAAGQSSVQGLAFSPHSDVIYTLAGQYVYKWAPKGRLLGKFKVCNGWGQALAVSPDGTRVATATASKGFNSYALAFWTPEGKLVKRIASHRTYCIRFSADSRWLASGGYTDRRMIIFDRDGREIRSFRTGRYRNSSPAHLALSPDNRIMAIANQRFKPVDLALWTVGGQRVRRFNNYNSNIIAMKVEPASDLIVTTCSDGRIRYWSLDGRLLKQYAGGSEYAALLAIAPNRRYIVTGNRELTVWGADGQKLATARVNKGGGRSLAISNDSKMIITGDMYGNVSLIPLEAGKRIKRFKAHKGHGIQSLAVHPGGKLFATGSYRGSFRIWDMQGNLKAAYDLPPDAKPPFSDAYAMKFTPDGKHLIVASSRAGRELAIFDMKAREVAVIATGNRCSNSGGLAISSDGKLVATSMGASFGIWDLETLRCRCRFRGHDRMVIGLAFANHDRHLVSATHNGLIKIWNIATGASMAMLSNQGEWAIFNKDGYFDASRHGGDAIAIVKGLHVYGVDQLAPLLNRPDIIYERLGLGDDRFLDHFRACFADRLDRYGADFDTAVTVSAPVITLEKIRREDKFVHIDFKADDPVNGLKAYQVYVNNVPLYAGLGKPVAGHHVLASERIELTAGENKIELSAFNRLGIEALRVPTFATYRGTTKGALYFVGFGISRYRNAHRNLRYARKDVLDLANLAKRYQGHFSRVRTLVLTDGQVTRQALAQVRTFLAGAKVDDTVIMMVSGHGGYELSRRAAYYYLTYDGDLKHLARTAISYEELEALLSGIAPRRKLLLMDTCASGALNPRQVDRLMAQAGKAGLQARVDKTQTTSLSSSPRPYLLTRNRYIYNDLRRRTGSIVFSSSMADELSLESDKLKNGVFTAAVIKALTNPATDRNKDGRIAFEELEAMTKGIVVIQTAGIQHPTVDRDNTYQRLELPVLVKEKAGSDN
jgi:WD40 repeat protein